MFYQAFEIIDGPVLQVFVFDCAIDPFRIGII